MILLNLWIEIDHSGGSATGPVGCGESASELGCSGESAVRPGASVKSVPASGAFGKLLKICYFESPAGSDCCVITTRGFMVILQKVFEVLVVLKIPKQIIAIVLILHHDLVEPW